MRPHLRVLYVCVCASLASCTTLRRGDLLFHITEQENHITGVTGGNADHVAIFLGGDSVLEAVPRLGVGITRLNHLLTREQGMYLVGRVRNADVEGSLSRAMTYIGQAYDSLYLPNDDAIYCSELVELAYYDKYGHKIFHTTPMSFHDSSGQITDYWKQFYGRQNMDVPEGEAGTNPSNILKSRHVKIKKFKSYTKKPDL